MRKNLLLLMAAACLAGKSNAQTQPCGTDQMHQQLLAQHPELAMREAEYEKQIQAALKKIDYKTAAKTTTVDQSGNPDFWYDIPIVVHVIHDYDAYASNTGAGNFIPDTAIYNAVKYWNLVYANQIPDTADVIAPFKKYIGNAHIRLHLATIDPNGRPTHGITRRRSYLTFSGGESAKFDDWQPTSYVNIWYVNTMSKANDMAAAYAHLPADVTFIPQYDGVISLASYMSPSTKTMNHEMGHVFNLQHPWGGTNNPEVACGDDGVDDTPPTKGHNPQGCTATALYDSVCATNYFKLSTDPVTGAIILHDYPDTVNSQNIMDYTYCQKMFTKGQVDRMHAALNNSIGGRNNLWDSANLASTGALMPMPDLPPVPEFSVVNTLSSSYLNKNANFTFPGNNIKFINETQNDTLSALSWSFDHGASSPTSSSLTNFTNSFSEPGWVTVTMKATGTGTGDVTTTFPNAVFVADNAGIDVSNYSQEFSASGDRDKWPTFNYYNNEFQWKLANVGMYDNTSMMYTGFDNTVFRSTGLPMGDFDDMFSVPANLSPYTASGCNLNFYYSGASRSANTLDINDSMYIDYSVNKSATWTSLAKLGKNTLLNKGAVFFPYVPQSPSDWAPMTIPLPPTALTPYTTFRFRYKPNVGQDAVTSTGNNFYIDGIKFSTLPAEASNVKLNNIDVAIVPNPTQGDATVMVNDANGGTAKIVVTDITGKVVYTASQVMNGTKTSVVIPHAAIGAQGMYLVQTTTGSQVNTQKLVVY